MSFRARYWATEPKKPLLGGVLASTSSSFDTEDEAMLRLEGALDINRKSGRPCAGHVVEGDWKPDIYHHECAPGKFSRMSQAKGGKCFSCGRVLP